MVWLVEIIFFVINIGLGKYQAYRFDYQQKRINHTLWAFGYCLLLVPVYFLTRNWWLIAACATMHLPVFNTSLNFFRRNQRPFWQQLFYTHPEDPLGSWTDQIWGRCYPVVFMASLALLIFIEIKL